jgi:predicted transposase/invertase (TIGR01784 family)
MDDEFRAAYRAHLKTQNDRISREANAEARGIALGEERGELKKARETARTMLADGVPIATVSKYTGLSLEEIEALKNK